MKRPPRPEVIQRLYRLLALAIAGALLPLVVPATASAVTSVQVSARDVTVRYSGCAWTSVRVTGNWRSHAHNEIRIVVKTPAGWVFDQMTVRDDPDGVVTRRVRFCDDDRAGVYRVQATAVGYDQNHTVVSKAQKWTSTKFTLIPKKKSAIRHRVIYKPSRPVYKYLVPGQLLRQGHGYKGQRVLLLAWIIDGWYEIDATRSGRRGIFGWEFKPNNFEWSYYFWGNGSTEESATGVFRTRGRYARQANVDRRPTLRQVRALVTRS